MEIIGNALKGCDATEDLVISPSFEKEGIGEEVPTPIWEGIGQATVLGVSEEDEFVRIDNRKRAQKQGVNETEDGGIGTYPKTENEDGGSGEAPVADEPPHGMS